MFCAATTEPASLGGADKRSRGGRPRLDALEAPLALGSVGASPSAPAEAVRGRLGVLLAGVVAFLFLAALGMGVPLDLRGRPRRLGVSAFSIAPLGSSSMASLIGTVVVTARGLRRVADAGLDEAKRRRLGPAVALLFSVSTVTRSFWGVLPWPTSSSNLCFRGVFSMDMNLPVRWLRVTRCEEGKKLCVVGESLRGSGDDMMSTDGVAMFATLCQRRLKGDSSRLPEFPAGGIGRKHVVDTEGLTHNRCNCTKDQPKQDKDPVRRYVVWLLDRS